MTDSNSATVEYQRRVTRKDADGNYDSMTVGGGVTRTYGAELDGTQLVAAWERLFDEFKKTVDAQIDGVPVVRSAVAETPREPLSPEPGGWIANTVNQNTNQIQERIESGESTGSDPATGTPPASLLSALAQNSQPVSYSGAKVFNVDSKQIGNNSVINIRMGKRGPDGIPGQYTTGESWDDDIIQSVSDQKIREGDLVNVWGYFKAWKNNPSKFNLVIQRIERSG